MSEFKANPSRYFAVVKAGGEVLITENGRLVARLSPFSPGDDWSATIDILVATGRARRPTARLPASFFDDPLVADPEGRVLKALLENRHGPQADE